VSGARKRLTRVLAPLWGLLFPDVVDRRRKIVRISHFIGVRYSEKFLIHGPFARSQPGKFRLISVFKLVKELGEDVQIRFA
jgi:hypothetical protein